MNEVPVEKMHDYSNQHLWWEYAPGYYLQWDYSLVRVDNPLRHNQMVALKKVYGDSKDDDHRRCPTCIRGPSDDAEYEYTMRRCWLCAGLNAVEPDDDLGLCSECIYHIKQEEEQLWPTHTQGLLR